ncbi:hypothetical protein Tco_0348301 [Tanacetum coccineum]
MDNEVGVTSLESTTQTLPSFEEYTPPVTYPEEVEKTLGTLIEEVPSFDGPEPQPLLNSPSLDVSLGDVIGPEPPIKPHSLDSSRMKEKETVTFEKNDEKITFMMPHKMEESNHIDFKDINTDYIPPFVLKSNDDRGKTYYSDSLTLGSEYREDKSISKEI